MTRARDVANLIGSGNYSSTTFTATAGQTAFTLSHTQGFVQVFMNGLLLDETVDYTSNGSAITLTSGAAAGDEIEVVKYNTFSVGDALPKSGGTMTGDLTIDTNTFHVDVADNRLGIGTSTPTKKLTISENAAAGEGILLSNEHNQAGTYSDIRWQYQPNETSYSSGIRFKQVDTTHGGQLEFYTDNASGTYTKQMQITENGHVTMPNQPAWAVYANGRTGWQSTTLQKTPYDTVIHAEPSSAYSTTNFRYTAPVAGRYWVQISQNGISDIILYIYKNGAVYHGGEFRSNPTGSWEHYTIGTVVQLSVNDYLEAYVKLGNSSGYGWNGASSTWDHFSGFLIG